MQKEVSSVLERSRYGVEFSDAHCHLDMFNEYSTVVGDAVTAGVRTIITAGGSRSSSTSAARIADGVNVFAVVGVDPAHSVDDAQFIDQIEDLIRSDKRKVVGIGEAGLDYKLAYLDKGAQEKAFRRQIDIAMRLDVPLVVHSRGAIDDVIRIVDETGIKKAMFHFFEGSSEQAQHLAGKGCIISIPPIESARRKRIINALSPSSIAIETDSPAVGESPIDVIKIASWIAEIKGLKLEEVASATTQTVKKLFGI